MAEKSEKMPDRRQFLAETMRYAALGAFGAIGGIALLKDTDLSKKAGVLKMDLVQVANNS